MFRAVVKTAFELSGRGTVLSVEILEGTVSVGDLLSVPMSGGNSRIVTVRAVDFVDYDISRPTFRAEVGLTVDGIASGDVAIGQVIQSRDAGPHVT